MRNLFVTFGWILIFALTCMAQQGSSITFQGKLNDGGFAANGSYDMAFRVFDNPSDGAGTQIGPTVTLSSIPVTNGIFSVELDFGHPPFLTIDPRFLEITMRRSGTSDPPSVLSPRQKITSSPFASQSFNATASVTALNANSATVARGLDCGSECVQSEEIESVAGSKVTGAVGEAATVSEGSGGGIVNILNINATLATIAGASSDYVFYSGTDTVIVPSGTTKTIAGSATTTLSTTGVSTSIRYGLCFQSAGGSVLLFGNSSLTRTITSTRSSVSYSGSATLAAGTYTVGFCIQNPGAAIVQTAERITGYIIAPK